LWNYFDTLVVSAQFLEVVFELVARSSAVDSKKVKSLRVLRVLRLLRILRVLRVLHLIRELRAIVSSIVGSFRSLVWVVVLLFLMMYIVAVFFTQSVTDHLMEKNDEDKERSEHDDTLHEFFGSLGRSILSLWQAISGGKDWDDFGWPLYAETGFITGLIFTGFIAFSLLALLNVVTGVFVQTALLSAKDEEDSFMTTQILQLLKVCRTKRDAMIGMDVISDSLEDPSHSREWKSIGVNHEDAKFLFKLLDIGSNGEVAFEEFLAGCLRLHGQAKAVDLLTVMQEGRKNFEQIMSKFVLLSEAMIEIHESVSGSNKRPGKRTSTIELLKTGMAPRTSCQYSNAPMALDDADDMPTL
jgi:hypothetical protein